MGCGSSSAGGPQGGTSNEVYHVASVLGEGGFCAVFKGRAKGSQEGVAIKVLMNTEGPQALIFWVEVWLIISASLWN